MAPQAVAVSSAALSHALIAQAVSRSVDGADTLDLSRQHIGSVPDEAVQELTKVGREGRGVRRLALSHNLLSSLPISFGQLHRLRYLNLKGNRLRSIPQALTQLPSLEILDLSKNALEQLPLDPGSLVSLRVLSLSHNSLRTLPGYLADFLELKVCKLEHNPLIWPPAWVLGRIGEDGREMDEREWIRDVRDFLRREPEPPAYSPSGEVEGGSSSSGDEGLDRRQDQQRSINHAYIPPSAILHGGLSASSTTAMSEDDRRRLRRAGAVGPTYAVHSRGDSGLSDLVRGASSPLADEGGGGQQPVSSALVGSGSSRGSQGGGVDPHRPHQQPFTLPPTYDVAVLADRARSPTTASVTPARTAPDVSPADASASNNHQGAARPAEPGPVVAGLSAQSYPGSGGGTVGVSGDPSRQPSDEADRVALSPTPALRPALQQSTPHAQFSTFSLSAPSPIKRTFPSSNPALPAAAAEASAHATMAPLPKTAEITGGVDGENSQSGATGGESSDFARPAPAPSLPNASASAPAGNLYGISPRQNSTDVLSSARGSFARSSISSAGGVGGHARHHSHHQTSALGALGADGAVSGFGGGGVGHPHLRQQYEQQHALQQAQLHAGVGVPRLGSKASAGSIHRLAFPSSGSGGQSFSRAAAAAAITGGPSSNGFGGGCLGGATGADEPTDSSTLPPPPPPPAGGQLIEGSRDSYFRRLSTLPPSTISASMPPALLTLIDGARGLLFALAQIQATLRRHPTSPLDDRFAGVLSRVLAPAAGATDGLINALDRFDSTSRRASSPPARVVRGVVEAVKANVGAYGKVIAVLIIQLKVSSSKLATSSSGRPPTPGSSGSFLQQQQHRENFEDIRFTRTLLLNLYGAMGEVSHAWQTMVPVLPAVAPLLRDPNAPPRQPLATPQQQSNGSGTSSGGAGASPQPHPGGRQTRLLSSASARGGQPMSPVPERLEGSGASASTMTPGTLDGLSPGTLPPPSRHKRGASSGGGGSAGKSDGFARDADTAAEFAIPAAGGQIDGNAVHHRPSHSRTHSQKIQREAQQHREAQALARQQQQTLQQQADADIRRQEGAQQPTTNGELNAPDSPDAPDLAGQLLEEAVQTGFAVWNLMEQDLQWAGPSVDANHSPSRQSIAPGPLIISKPIADLLSVIALAKAHTRQLHETMRATTGSSGGNSTADEQTLIEHATVFFQSVRKVAGMTRAVFESERRDFRRDLKVGLGKLTRLTMESATLLHVSNLKRPGTAMSAYTYGSEEPPPVNGLYPYPPPTPTPSVVFATPYATPPAQQSSTGTGMRPLALGRSRSALGGESGPFVTPSRADVPGQIPLSTPRAGPSAFIPGHGGRGKGSNRSIGGGPGQRSFGGSSGGGRSQEGIPF